MICCLQESNLAFKKHINRIKRWINILSKDNTKRAGVVRQNILIEKLVKADKKDHYIIKGSIHQEVIMITNIYVLNIRKLINM